MANNIIIEKFEKALQELSPTRVVSNNVKYNKNKYNIIGFYAPYDNSGRTTTLLNIAYALAQKGKSVCVADFDFMRPDVFHYLVTDTKQVKERSIKNKLVNRYSPLTEFICRSEIDKNINFITSYFAEHPNTYCSAESGDAYKTGIMDLYCEIITELSSLYDYVLVDIPADIADIATMASFKACDFIFSFIDYSLKSIETLFKYNDVLTNFGLPNILLNIVQSMIVEGKWDQAIFDETNTPYNLIAEIPYSERIRAAGANGEIFVNTSKNNTGRSLEYCNVIDGLAEAIMTLENREVE